MNRQTLESLNDFGEPIKPHPILDLDMSHLHRASDRSWLKALAMVGLVFILLRVGAYYDWSLWLSLPVALLAGFLSSRYLLYRVPRASKEHAERHHAIFEHLYNVTQSNKWSAVLTVAGYKVDLYSGTVDDVVARIVDMVRNEAGVGTTDCQAGHAPLCSHRLPVQLKPLFA